MEKLDLCTAPYRARVRYLHYIVPEERAGTEVGNLLRHGLDFSAALIKRVKWLEDGLRLDGVRVGTREKAAAGQELCVRLSDTERGGEIPPHAGPLDILYEDEDLLVVNKAAGVAVHPGIGHWENTLGSFLLNYYDSEGIPADFHPVHRLDKGTSGAMVVAKHAYAQELLRQQLHTDDFQREYLAVCDGVPAAREGRVDLPIAHSKTSVILQEVRADGLPAQTDYCVLRESGGRSLVRLRLATGRTHQIRVHMKALGCPLTGDFLYGTENQALIARPALHSSRLSFLHPLSHKEIYLEVPLPEDMAALL